MRQLGCQNSIARAAYCCREPNQLSFGSEKGILVVVAAGKSRFPDRVVITCQRYFSIHTVYTVYSVRWSGETEAVSTMQGQSSPSLYIHV